MNVLSRLDSRTHVFTVSTMVTLALVFGGSLEKDAAFIAVFAALLLAAGRLRFVLFWLVLMICLAGLAHALAGSLSDFSGRMLHLVADVSRKLFFIVGAGTFLITVISVGDCIKSLEKMRLPWSLIVPSAICFRFLPALRHESNVIRDALRSRGLFSFSRFIRRPVATGELFLATLLFRTMAISEELAFSVSTRAVSEQGRKVWYREKNFHTDDLAFACALIGTVTAIAVIPLDRATQCAFAHLGFLQ